MNLTKTIFDSLFLRERGGQTVAKGPAWPAASVDLCQQGERT